MAPRSRRLRRPPMSPPLHTGRSLLTGLVVFISFIAIAVIWSSSSPSSDIPVPTAEGTTTIAQRTAAKTIYTNPEEIPDEVIENLDAVLILGGGAPSDLYSPPVYVQRRCDDAAVVFQRYQHLLSNTRNNKNRKKNRRNKRRDLLEEDNNESMLSILCISAGTAHVPQLLSKDGLPIWESTSCAAYIQQKYSSFIDSNNVYVETTSYDTISNAFYTRVSHTDINGWRNLLIITNEFHIDRSKAIFDWVFSVPSSSNTNKYNLFYLSSSNVGLSKDAIQARKEREASSMKTVQNILSKKYNTLSKVYQFLTKDHSLYTAEKLIERGEQAADEASEIVKKSYGGNSNA